MKKIRKRYAKRGLSMKITKSVRAKDRTPQRILRINK